MDRLSGIRNPFRAGGSSKPDGISILRKTFRGYSDNKMVGHFRYPIRLEKFFEIEAFDLKNDRPQGDGD